MSRYTVSTEGGGGEGKDMGACGREGEYISTCIDMYSYIHKHTHSHLRMLIWMFDVCVHSDSCMYVYPICTRECRRANYKDKGS